SGDLLHGELYEEKAVLAGVVEGGARVVFEAARTDRIVRQRRGQMRGLTGKVRHPHPLGDPGIVEWLPGVLRPTGIPKLPMQAPARVAAFSDINKAFALVFEVAVVVHRKKISELAEGDL